MPHKSKRHSNSRRASKDALLEAGDDAYYGDVGYSKSRRSPKSSSKRSSRDRRKSSGVEVFDDEHCMDFDDAGTGLVGRRASRFGDTAKSHSQHRKESIPINKERRRSSRKIKSILKKKSVKFSDMELEADDNDSYLSQISPSSRGGQFKSRSKHSISDLNEPEPDDFVSGNPRESDDGVDPHFRSYVAEIQNEDAVILSESGPSDTEGDLDISRRTKLSSRKGGVSRHEKKVNSSSGHTHNSTRERKPLRSRRSADNTSTTRETKRKQTRAGKSMYEESEDMLDVADVEHTPYKRRLQNCQSFS
uniref:Uncharacterized protein n=1 Tax=Mucochytrium quahogii TaxID=96639 RepID=A0A7S2SPT9_9STRA|mmetsp:Transcript_14085/g.23004  ORF Transcript_14085/g.23004 Transcript_14085/m.23004 type:complete len:305 (+) Transcript_14085:262-1176(+)|eukprot:CAMPEP_0203763498 /NCGR_PEP_ID=MMETSP0098-20131031/16326_1 /ASSEMBLY_ACC=CAM_ASM_000208 /TAXON_ID=96639 /ORGANISM=" , Strain NY0313808BC1" /LENGTH=304 /DNA_ID=CAMNT_0050658399 /DNA_START=221 /DNA_END=1135 /DNA_ORIENTATION=+